jgi:uncharacterized SAM-binding protein YcdF (DUF218 family)
MDFFTLSKVFGLLLDPLNVVFLLLVIVLLLLWRGKQVVARWLLTMVVAAMAVVILLPIGDLLLLPLEQRFPLPNPWPAQIDGIVMLGGAQRPLYTRVYGQAALNAHAERMIKFVELARAYPHAKLLFSGGSGDLRHQDVSEADTVKLFLRQLGFAPQRVLYDSRSRNTYENAVFSKKLADPKPGEKWLLITSAADIPRAVGVFRQLGWPVIAVPCDYEALPPDWLPSTSLLDAMKDIRHGLHEWIGLFVYYLTGKSASLFPAVDLN